MAIIKTSKGIEILVDDSRFEEINTYKWSINSSGYACTQASKKRHGHNKWLYMHRFLTNCPKGFVVDHLNCNKLDNRLENLEVITQSNNIKRAHKNGLVQPWKTHREWLNSLNNRNKTNSTVV